MPTTATRGTAREALRYAVRQIRALQPAVEVIAPQHGMVISGDLVPLFLDRMQAVLNNCLNVLRPNGKIAVLLGGFSDRGRYQPLSQLLLVRAIDIGLWPATTEIIRFQHGNTSSKKTYSSSFIPGLHDTCVVLHRRR